MLVKVKPRHQRKNYLDRLSEGNEEAIKQPHREEVLDYLKIRSEADNASILTLPGGNWKFEKMCEGVFTHCSIVGVERDSYMFDLALSRIPGVSVRVFKYKVPSHRKKFLAAVTSSGYSLVKTTLSDFVLQWGSIAPFTEQFKNFTAVWLDTCNNLGSKESRTTLSNLYRVLSPKVNRIPVAVTLQVGREHIKISGSGDAMQRRERLIARLLSNNPWWRFEAEDHWKYSSARGGHMGVWCGVMTKKEKKPIGWPYKELTVKS